MDEVIGFILDTMPAGVLVFRRDEGTVYRNRQAERFLRRHSLPEEIGSINARIFEVIGTPRLKDVFPGDICFNRRLEGSSSNWIFRFHISDGAIPFVCLFISEETVSSKLDLNKLRGQFRLTRRETDILRRVLDGLKNAEIADDLDISGQTVKDHLSNIYMKTGVENRFALISCFLTSLKAEKS